MLSPNDAYNLLVDKIPDLVGDTVYDYGDYYVIDNCIHGDFNTESYKIDKKTGDISELSFDEWIDLIKSSDDDEEADKKNTYTISRGVS